MSETSYLIAVATYKRQRELARLLDSIRVSVGNSDAPVDIVVVDNDPAGSARHTVDISPLPVNYVHEPEPGIASARNAGLRSFDSRHSAIIFVDDDEWVSETWFDELIGYWRDSTVDVVQGAVISEVPSSAPKWIRKAGFYQRSVPATGTRLLSAATNNTLLSRAAWVRAGSPKFDSSFSETGGSDWDFFWFMRRSGSTIAICAEAVVYEDIPAGRLSYRWLVRRAFRSGIVHTRVRMKYRDRPVRTAARGCLRGAMYLAKLLFGLLAYRTVSAKSFNEVHFELGRVFGLVGVRVYEYRRPTNEAAHPSSVGSE